MPAKPFRFVQHRPAENLPPHPNDKNERKGRHHIDQPLLFVHRHGGNLQNARTSIEAQAITAHIAGQHRKWRRGQKKIEFHPSVSKILSRKEMSEQLSENVMKSAKIRDSCLHGKLRHVISDLNVIVSDCDRCPASLEMFKPWSFTIGDVALDPFTPSEIYMEPDVKNLLYLYFQVIHPFAKFLHSDWEWFDRIPEIQATPALCFAIAAYASLFFDGMRQGSRGIILPPPLQGDKTQSYLWPMPTWFRYHTKCLGYLTSDIKDKATDCSSSVFHAILFSLRLSVLLADGATARVHLAALKAMSNMEAKDLRTLDLEATVVKVNLISAYLHKTAIFTTDRADDTGITAFREVQHDPGKWTDKSEWRQCRNMMLWRLLTWHDMIPNHYLEDSIRSRIKDMDPAAHDLDEMTLATLSHCHQLALYLWAFLVGVNFDPGCGKVRLRVLELQELLRSSDIAYLWVVVPNTLFNILFAGAFASRGFVERVWFVDQLSNSTVRLRYMPELFAMLFKFSDPSHARMALLEELLLEMIAAKGEELSNSPESIDLYLGPCTLPPRGHRPFTFTPDLSVPLVHIEAS